MAKSADADIDKLFQLPLADFTAARNALAKAAGKNGAAIRELAKPPVAAWAVNQLYWRRRNDYETLIEASDDMRRTHKSVIEGKRGDLRSAGHAHEKALEAALKSTLSLMKESGQPVTDVTKHQILNTLRALPSDDEPGRLTRALAPGGFELLAGVKPAKPTKQAKAKESAERTEKTAASSKAEKQSAKDKAAREAAERAVREAEQHVRRAEFEAARASREAERAAKRVEETAAAVDQAEQELTEARTAAATAKRDATAATRASETADKKARDAQSALEAAKSKLRTE